MLKVHVHLIVLVLVVKWLALECISADGHPKRLDSVVQGPGLLLLLPHGRRVLASERVVSVCGVVAKVVAHAPENALNGAK